MFDLRRRIVCSAVVMAAVLAPAIAHAAKRSYVVAVRPATPELAWRAEALQLVLTADLADDRLTAHLPSSTTGVDLVVDAVVDATSLRYDMRPLWSGAPAPVRDIIVLVGSDRVTVAGVLRDRMHRLARAVQEQGDDPTLAVPSPTQVSACVVIVVVVVALPFVIAVRRRRSASRFPIAAFRRTVIWLVGIGGAAIGIASLGPTLGLVFAIGGLAWGGFAVVTVPIIFPPLPGLGRVDADELVGVLATWLGLVVRRVIAVALLYVPVGVVAWLAAGALDIDEPITFALVLPAAGLVARHVVRVAVAVAASELDATYAADTDAPAWDSAVRAYVIGYLRRAGLPVDDELLRRVRFVPGKADVAFYGGGLTETRIVVPRTMLELALSPWGRPHDYAAPRVSSLHWTQWNAGLVMPTEPGAVLATREQRLPREMPFDEASEREPIGEPPTLVGIIEPTALDPRKSYRPTEDPLWLDYDAGEEHDGTDAGDRDFLFGIAVHALGAIQRHAIEPHTLAIVARRNRVIDRIATRLGSDAAGDVHAAIAGARHHLIQYLAWRASGRADLLTARAYLPELEAASRRALADLDSMAGFRARLTRLSPFVRGAQARPTRWRRAAIAGAIVACTGALAIAVASAVRYHSTYVERMEKPHG